MTQELVSVHEVVPALDDQGQPRVDGGNPAGGLTTAKGLEIAWQNGPQGHGAARQAPNGCLVETVILAAIDRLTFFQTANGGRLACAENQRAIGALAAARAALEARDRDRDLRGVEGTYQV